jgi:hypothetical protein
MPLPEFNENGDLPAGVYRARFGASVFWIQPSVLIGDSLDAFVAHWQVKRDGSKRGIVEVVS